MLSPQFNFVSVFIPEDPLLSQEKYPISRWGVSWHSFPWVTITGRKSEIGQHKTLTISSSEPAKKDKEKNPLSFLIQFSSLIFVQIYVKIEKEENKQENISLKE